MVSRLVEPLWDRPIREITTPEIRHVLRSISASGRRHSANRARGFIGAVYGHAAADDLADNDPSFPLRGKLETGTVKHRAAITNPSELGGFLRAIDGYEGQPTTQAALKLIVYVFARPGELRLVEWREFDLAAALWTIPREHTKMRREEHFVPLAPQAIAILRDLREITGRGRLVFPGLRTPERPISENTLNAAMRRLGYPKDDATAHGSRATASTLLNESGKWHPDAIERQLQHEEPNQVRRAYLRGEFWEERVRMMSWWADYLDGLRDGDVLSTSSQGVVHAHQPSNMPGGTVTS